MARSIRGAARRVADSARYRAAQAVAASGGAQRALEAESGAIALSFDDGPDPDHTPAILDELRRLNVRATFFVVGRRARAHPTLVQRIVAEGHALGSHSSSHPEPWRVPVRRLVGEYRQGRREVEAAAGREVSLFRPPKGYVDLAGVVAMRAARVRPWLWTIDTRDWVPGVTSDDIVVAFAGVRAGDVVLLHDAIEDPLAPSAVDRTATCSALPRVVGLARERGLRFACLA